MVSGPVHGKLGCIGVIQVVPSHKDIEPLKHIVHTYIGDAEDFPKSRFTAKYVGNSGHYTNRGGA